MTMTHVYAFLVACLLPVLAAAQSFDHVVEAELRPGWRLANGEHIAALHMRLEPGWKTYWRAPGEAGIPPMFEWTRMRNARDVTVNWPTPKVYWQSGMRSVGYEGNVVLPLRVTPGKKSGDIRLSGTIDIGICKDVCLPHQVSVDAVLPAGQTRPDPMIAAAMADIPFTAREAGITHVRCDVSATSKGIGLRVAIDMPKGTGREETVIEFHDPMVHVGEPRTSWQGSTLISEARMTHLGGGAFAMDRSGVRITVLGGRMPLDLQGCTR